MDINDYNKLKAGKILAIDYGLKRVGLAVSNIERTISFPLITILEKEAMHYIKEYSLKNTISAFILGLPLNLNGQESDFSLYVKKFANNLAIILPTIPIYYIDERFTSKIASQIVASFNLNKTKRKDKKRLDNISAALILQSWIDRHSKI